MKLWNFERGRLFPQGLPGDSQRANAILFSLLVHPAFFPDFVVQTSPDGWRFWYEPLRFETGSMTFREVMEAERRLLEHDGELFDWLHRRVEEACDFSPLRVMQIAQVGL